jgi:hypothetical protein
MKTCVSNTNYPEQLPPDTLQELVDFVNLIASKPDRMYIQISGYGIEVVEALAHHFGTNFFDWRSQKGVDLNPFTIIYVDAEGQIVRNAVNERSKILIYAKRPIHHSNS